MNNVYKMSVAFLTCTLGIATLHAMQPSSQQVKESAHGPIVEYYYSHYPKLTTYWSVDPESQDPHHKLDGILSENHAARHDPRQQHGLIGRGAPALKKMLPLYLAKQVRENPDQGIWPGLTDGLNERIKLEDGRETYGDVIAVVTYWKRKADMEAAGY